MKKLNKMTASGIAFLLAFGLLFQSTGLNFEKRTVASELTDQRVRVDINVNDNRKDAYSDTFDSWFVSANDIISTKIFHGITCSLSNGGKTGGNIKSASYKRLLKSDFSTPRLTMDGAIISDATNGGVIKLELAGLSEGKHSLQTWHSFFDNVAGSTMSVSINGITTATGIKSVTRITKDSDAGISYSEFEVKKGETVTVLIKPEGNGTYDNAVLNAFAIDCTNPFDTIQEPCPKENDFHYETASGLSWAAGNGAVSHDVYFGTDFDAVHTATHSSEEFLGNQTATGCALGELVSTQRYYWRVDEIKSDGSICKGDVLCFEPAHLSFPSAEGYGRFAKGGRGGRVIEVTNLNDSGEGSLRYAIEEESGPRVVVFRVGGVIKLQSKLVIKEGYGDVYIAGQTAPGDGITIINYAFGIYYANDVIIRNIRVRVGDSCQTAMDGIGMAGANNSIVDHCSISWTTDEGTSSRGAHNITFQHNIIAEALHDSVHYNADDRTKSETHSFAGSISGNIGSFHHNLLVDCTGRNWSLAGGVEQDGATYAGQLDVRNNVVYNFRDRTTDGGVYRINFVNNYYKKGAVSKDMQIFTIDGNEMSYAECQKAYVSGNMLVDKTNKVLLAAETDAWSAKMAKAIKNATEKQARSDVPFYPSYVNTETAAQAYQSVLNDVGATMPKQDAYDTRYISETKNGTYTYAGSKKGLKGIVDSQSDVGGYPEYKETYSSVEDNDHDGMADSWEYTYGLNPSDAKDANGFDLSKEGYTNLEMYINELAGDKMIYMDSVVPAPATATPAAKPTTTPTVKPTATATPKPTATPTTKPTVIPTVMPTVKPTAAPTGKPTATPTVKPTATPTVKPTATPVVKPTATPTVKPTATPTVKPTATPTVRPTATPAVKPTTTPTVKPTDIPTPAPTTPTTSLPKPTPPVTPSPTGKPLIRQYWGDIDRNGRVELTDANICLKAALGITQLNSEDEKLADVNHENGITLEDAQIALKTALGIINLVIV